MHALVTTRIRVPLLLFALLLLGSVQLVQADQGSLELSSYADFSTLDQRFRAEDVLHIRLTVDTENFDVTAVEESSFEIAPEGEGESISGALTNHLDGTFTASVPVEKLAGEARSWEVKVEIETTNDREIEARSRIIVVSDAAAATFTLHGVVKSVTSDSITVGGISFGVNGESEFVGINGLDAITAGIGVIIEYKQLDSGGYLAVSIELEENKTEEETEDEKDEEDEEEVEVEGTITAVTESSLTVGEITFTLTDTTAIESEDGVALASSDLYTGLKVEVEGQKQSDGTVTAVEIEITEALETEFEVEGQVTAVSDSSFQVGQLAIQVASTTTIEGESDAALTLADIRVGMWAEVEGTVQTSGAYTAEKVEVENRFEEEDVEITGTIESISSSQITVGALTFAVDAETEIRDRDEQTITLDALSAGTVVEVEGHYQAGSMLTADKIKVEDEVHNEGEIKGAVTAAGGDSIIVEDIVFRVANQTILEGVDSHTNLSTGQRVKIDFRVLGDGSRLALKIETEAEDDSDVYLSGIIQSTGATGITVADISINVSGAAEITGADGAILALADLSAGTAVEIKAEAISGGLDALEIEVEQSVLLGGTVKTSSSTGDAITVQVAGREIEITNETLIIGEGNTQLALEDIQVGVYIQVRGVSQASSAAGKTLNATLTAERVRVQESGSTTAVEKPAELPAAFRLEQNYPNPFNPSTTIRYTAPKAGYLTITVYNVLGRKVAVLVDRKHAAGTYTVQFNGAGLPSGLYFYRLQAPHGITKTRKMMLVK